MHETASESLFEPLHDTSIVALEGVDAIDFAQSQFANDVRALAVNTWQWNAWLTAKGRGVALFMLLRSSEQGLRAVCTGMPAATLASALSRTIFRRKVTLKVVEGARLWGCFDTQAGETRPDRTCQSTGEEQWLGEMDDRSGRRWRISTHTPCPEASQAFETAWQLANLRRGLPYLQEQGSELTAHQLGLHRLPALSLSKGCYPGQEIVARTHYLGKGHRQLTRIAADSLLRDGSKLLCEGREVATVMNSLHVGPNAWEALACLSAQDEDNPIPGELQTEEGHRVSRLPFSNAFD